MLPPGTIPEHFRAGFRSAVSPVVAGPGVPALTVLQETGSEGATAACKQHALGPSARQRSTSTGLGRSPSELSRPSDAGRSGYSTCGTPGKY